MAVCTRGCVRFNWELEGIWNTRPCEALVYPNNRKELSAKR